MANFLLKLMTRYLRMFMVFIALFFFSISNAQGPILGYNYLGAYNGHHYYVSEGVYKGVEIAGAVAGTGGYAATLTSAAENAEVSNMVRAYNKVKYGGGTNDGAGGALAYGGGWDNLQNVWIGLTDEVSEGNFIWGNGENCSDFRNWNEGEPNNFAIEENYTELLIMSTYFFSPSDPNHDPFGKWNDWFNETIPYKNNEITKLSVLLEVGPSRCTPLDIILSGTINVSCYGDDNGTASFSISSGLAPFTYKLDDGEESLSFNNPTFTINDLESGPHTVLVADANGNTKTISFTITQPAAPLEALSSLVTNVKCNGGSNGSVTVTATGGTAPYNITGPPTSGLSAGTYTYTVTDANGCIDEVTVIIAEPGKLILTAETKPACGGNLGSAIIIATGGTPPYTGDGLKTGLTPGNHTFTVTDDNGCTENIIVIIDGTTGGFNVMPETFPNQFNTGFYKSLYNKTFVGSSGTWTVSSNAYATMVVTTPYYSPSTSHALKVANFKTWNCGEGWTKAVSPKLNLTAPCCPEGVKLNFTLWTYNVVSGDTKAKLEIDFSNNNGATWTEVWSRTSAQLFTSYGANGKAGIHIPVPTSYHTENFRYRIRGEMASNDYNNFYLFIDDIKIGSPANCNVTPPVVNGRTMNGETKETGLGAETMGAKKPVETIDEMVTDFAANVSPNPTNAEFELKLSSKEALPVSIRVMDMLGRTVKTMRISANQSVRFGAEFRSGSYVVEIIQGHRKEIVKLIKL